MIEKQFAKNLVNCLDVSTYIALLQLLTYMTAHFGVKNLDTP